MAVSTNWSLRGTPGLPTGSSERIIVHPLSTPSTEITRVNLDYTTGTQATNIVLPTGKYIFHVDLYSGTAESGNITGSLDTVVDTTVSTTLSISIGAPIASIALGPAGDAVLVGQSGWVYASPTTSTGTLTFAAPGDLSFASSATGTLTAATDSTDQASGDLFGVVAGTANVTARSASANVSSSPLPVVVNPVNSSTKLWTIMVFLNASNNLAPYALPNYLQMQQAALRGTNTQIVVAWKESRGNYNASNGYDWSFSGPDDTRYYLVQPSSGANIVGSPIVDLGAGVDMGASSAVANFVAYCKAHYPANRYLLDMWDHGDGWQEYVKRRSKTGTFRGISYDQETGNHIDSWQMDQCFANGNGVDILAYDACNMQMLECGYQVRNLVSYIVGSEDQTPAQGYDYSVALAPFFTNPSGASATLARSFVDQMANSTQPGSIYANTAICQSVVTTSQLTSVAIAVDAFGQALLANKSTIKTIVDNARLSAKVYYDSANQYNLYYDAVSLATVLKNSAGVPPAVATAATGVLSAVQADVLYSRYDASNLDAGSNGLAVDFSDATTFNATQVYTGGVVPSAASQYANLQFAKDYPNWYNWLLVAP